MIKWTTNTGRRKTLIATGIKGDYKWYITQTATKMFELHFMEIKLIPMITRREINDCKRYAEVYI